MHTIFKTKRKGTNKSKVLFSCHPSDFDRYFSELTYEILSVQDCSIYYLEDQNYNPEDLEDYKVQLSQFNLFVFPITYKFLSEESRTKDIDFKYAIENNYPVLPILVEPDLYDMFNKFNTIQVLDKTTNDPTQDPYIVKLEKYVKSVLLDDDTVERIKKAFDAYIFLSYRKKDRKFAQEIMSLIHKSDFMRDIAIWYDEFLTPGEDFNDEISENLLKSKLMALVVTPNINERYGEKGNYVIEEEYPRAVKENKPVLPIEAVKTNKEELKNNFKDIDDPIYKEEVDKLTAYFKQVFGKYNNPENDNDPEHLFFIGLAYLNGIDTDRDPEKGIELLKQSAKMSFSLANKELSNIYQFGKYKSIDKKEAIKWQERYIELIKDTVDIYTNEIEILARMYDNLDYYSKSLDVRIANYELRKKIYGQNDLRTFFSLQELEKNYAKCGKFFDAYKLKKQSFLIKDNVDFNQKLSNDFVLPTNAYITEGNYDLNLSLLIDCYEKSKELYGKDNPMVQDLYKKILNDYAYTNNKEVSLELNKICYEVYKVFYGEKDERTLYQLNNLANQYGLVDNKAAYIETHKKYSVLLEQIHGKYNEKTINSIIELAHAYSNVGDTNKCLELLIECYQSAIKAFGEKNDFTIEVLSKIAGFRRFQLNDVKGSIDDYEKCYSFCRELYGDNHWRTNPYLIDLAEAYLKLGEKKKYLEYILRFFEIEEENIKKEREKGVHNYSKESKEFLYSQIVGNLHGISNAYSNADDEDMSLKYLEKCYEKNIEFFGENDSSSLKLLSEIQERRGIKKTTTVNVDEDNLDFIDKLEDSLLEKMNNKEYEECIELANKCYELNIKKYGDSYHSTIIAGSRLAFILNKCKDYNRSIEISKKIYDIFSKSMYDVPWNLIDILLVLIDGCISIENYKDAYEYGLECSKIENPLKGRQEEYNFELYSNMAYACHKLKMSDEAIKYGELSLKLIEDSVDGNDTYLKKSLTVLTEEYENIDKKKSNLLYKKFRDDI